MRPVIRHPVKLVTNPVRVRKPASVNLVLLVTNHVPRKEIVLSTVAQLEINPVQGKIRVGIRLERLAMTVGE